MRIAYLIAGAGGMYCGSCLRDNTLVTALRAAGRDVIAIPLYTPLRTDEPPVTTDAVFYGGINVYLQQKSGLFRRTPRFVDRVLDAGVLLRGAARMAGSTRPEDLGALTVSVLRGEHGAQRKELERLIGHLQRLAPDVVHLPNLMFAGVAPRVRAALGARVLCTLSGEDLFVDQLPEPYRAEAFALIRERAADIDGFVAVTQYYADHAAAHFGLPPGRVHHVPMGVRTDDVGPAAAPGGPFTIGYLARVAPEKGLRVLCEALVELRRAGCEVRLRAAGYLGPADRGYFDETRAYVHEHGAGDAFEYVGEVGRRQKLEFLRTLHVLSVPTVYAEAKGLFVLEALAAGVPVVQPRHGSFGEIVQATGGGILCEPNDPVSLAGALRTLIDDPDRRAQLATAGRESVHARYHDRAMADAIWSLYEKRAT